MGDQSVGWEPNMAPHEKMPPGYILECITYQNFDLERRTGYYWWHDETRRDGPIERYKARAIKRAWDDWRAGTPREPVDASGENPPAPEKAKD